MKQVLTVIITLIMGCSQPLFAQPSRYPIIPWPSSLVPAAGEFNVTAQTVLKSDPIFANEAEMLGTLLGVKQTTGAASIELRPDNTIAAEEGYKLVITQNKVLLTARTPTGMFRGIQTIRQLLPLTGKALLPCVTISDAPTYAWRGMHLDVSRHFFSIDYLKKFIDVLALYKMNKLHLHLTDDQGWRIEIKKYPLLTEKGAWRTFNNQDSACMRRAKDDPDFTIDPAHIIQKDGKTLYGGFYTQDEMRGLVAYATARHIDIIPEIDMPGHMMAAIDQYNWLSCDSTSSFGALFSKPICPCLPATYQFAQDIYTEIIDIFPSTYLHIGGDEVDRTLWAKSEDCKRLMQQEGLKTTAELQAYFIRKMEAFFNSKGRKLIGWDEILEGGVTQTAYIMYWRTWVPKAPIEAAQHGNYVIMAPGNPLYFDGTQDRNSLPNVYHFDPIPAALTPTQAKLILGAQAEMWTEMIPNEQRADYMFMPRMTALAEVLWSKDHNYDSYLDRLQSNYPRLDQLHVRYRLPDLSGFLQSNVFLNTDTLRIAKPLKSMTLRYTTDHTVPTAQSPVLDAPIVIREDKHFRIAAFRADGSRGDIYDLDYKKQPLAEPVAPRKTQPGLTVHRFKGSFKQVAAMATLQPDTTGIATNFNVPKALETPSFGLQYRGYLDVPANGIYSFYLTCDDGGLLTIADREVINNDGNHPPLEKTGQVALKKGLQKFDLDFIEGGGGYTLKLKYSFNGSKPQDIPAAWLKHSSEPKPYGALPTPRQLAWHEMEMYCLIHFGVDTYTDKEWGYGDEDPKIVNPVRFDAKQIVGAAKAGGFKGVVIVAKHHDGLCLWPTKTTEHNITKSPWRNGHGDMIKEYREACDALGMKMGLYCSPWDRNNPQYGTPEYVKTYRAQIKELYSNYGPLFISWHDGANGGDGYYGGARETRKIDRTTYYGWDTTWGIVRQLQPGACIFGDVGPDVRWVGNEEGHAGTTCWATYTPEAPDPGKKPANGYNKYWLATNGTRNGEFWLPAECDVPFRPGWFYHPSQDGKAKTPGQLLDLYYQSVGRGADLDLGLAPNREGRLDAADVANLKAFGDLLKRIFAVNLAKGATLTASNIRDNNAPLYGPAHLLDADRYSYWATDDNVTTPELTLTLAKPTTFNVIRLREDIKLGQRIDSFAVDAYKDNNWETIATGTSIGANRLLRLTQNITTSKLRLRIISSPVCIALSDFGLFLEPVLQDPYLVPGVYSSNRKKQPLTLKWPITPTATAVPPQDFTIDMGKPQTITAFTYLPRQDKQSAGIVDRYAFYTSTDGSNWQKVAEGEFGNIRANPLEQTIPLDHPQTARYFKFQALHVIEGNGVAPAGVGIITATPK